MSGEWINYTFDETGEFEVRLNMLLEEYKALQKEMAESFSKQAGVPHACAISLKGAGSVGFIAAKPKAEKPAFGKKAAPPAKPAKPRGFAKK